MEGRLFSSAVDLVHSFRPPASEVNTRCPAPCRLPAAHSWPGNPWESHMQGSPKHFHCPPALIFAPVGLAVHPPQGHKTQRLGCWQVGSADRDTGFRAGDVPGTRIQWWSWGLNLGLSDSKMHSLNHFLLLLKFCDHFPLSSLHPTIPCFPHSFRSQHSLSTHTHTHGWPALGKYREHMDSSSTEHRADRHRTGAGTVLTKNMDRVLRL